jgi:FdhD protein
VTTTPVRSQVQRTIRRLREGAWSDAPDTLAAEEPLEIRLLWQEDGAVQRKPIAITMRTPGDDFALAAGFLYGEGLIQRQHDVVDVSYCTDEDEDQAFNIVNVTLRPGLVFDASRLERNFYTTSSCGVCGKAALDALEVQGCSILPEGPVVSAELLCSLPDKLRAAQAVFDRTGGLHATGLFTPEGDLVSLREDVGRHNAFDKLVGEEFLGGRTPLDGYIAMLSGRASFELLQKALVARIPIVAAVGAPSSLAVQLADEFNITVCGFVRGGSLNVYTGDGRVAS